jgi:hypothetical protein
MTRVYSIGFDSVLSADNNEAFFDQLTKLGAFPMLRSQWALRTQLTAVEIRNNLTTYIDGGRLWVTEVGSSAHSRAINAE